MAESTEMAGVMTPSPKNSDAPAIPTRATTALLQGRLHTRWASAIRARMPPSPWLSARMTSVTYFTVTIRKSDQKIMERTPSTSVLLKAIPLNKVRLALKA